MINGIGRSFKVAGRAWGCSLVVSPGCPRRPGAYWGRLPAGLERPAAERAACPGL
ncbi:MAG: hypothetical protein K9L57_09055 [Spirochaetaceae bacterium]|nr:hypothetical protein [Spirochaetaceae bacterium]